jgi:hypothetical protein
MNRRQRSLVHKWIGLACLFIGLVVAERFLRANPWLFRAILLGGMVLALRYEGRPADAAGSSSDRIRRIVEANPWIKTWLVVCATCATALAIAAIHYEWDLHNRLSFGGLLAAIMLIGAPILVMGERDRYIELGTSDNAP